MQEKDILNEQFVMRDIINYMKIIKFMEEENVHKKRRFNSINVT